MLIDLRSLHVYATAPDSAFTPLFSQPQVLSLCPPMVPAICRAIYSFDHTLKMECIVLNNIQKTFNTIL